MKVIGIDPGLRALGLAELDVAGERPRVLRARVVHTVIDKDVERKADDLAHRMRLLAAAVQDFVADDPPLALCVEIKNLPRREGRATFTASTASALGRVRGLFDMLAQMLELPVFDIDSQRLKNLVVGNRSAEKPEVIAAIARLYPEVKHVWPLAKDDHEHVADAIGAVHTALQLPALRQLIRDRQTNEACA